VEQVQDDAAGGFDVEALVRFSSGAVSALAEAREEIDALNVYPVPDGDTGTNLFLTFEYAHNTLTESLTTDGSRDLGLLTALYARGLLLGARGNSGVIMSQLVGAFFKRLISPPTVDEPDAVSLAEAMAAATEAAYAAVGTPVEGTILTVARAASDAARVAAARSDATVPRVVSTAVAAAQEALDKTPDQLEVLRNAGVVDAGGRGLCVVLDTADTALTGRRSLWSQHKRSVRVIQRPVPTDDLTPDGPAYEVMYLLDASDEAIPTLRSTLQSLGDSLVVVGGDGLWNVHVHVDDVGAAVEAGIGAGRPYRIRVTHFAEQIARREPTALREGRGVVVVAFGTGLAALFREAGAQVVTAESGRRPSTAELLEAIVSAGTKEVVVLTNDRDVVPTAEAAARTAHEDNGLRVAVIPTAAQVQGLAALAVHEPGRSFEQDLVEMTAAARHARSGAVTVAARQAMTFAGHVEPGDVLGAVEGDFVIVGADLYDVAVAVIERMLGGGGELVTLVAGAGGTELAQRCADHLASNHPIVDVVTYAGGQERYPVLIGVE
jgi:hypothetical protein